MKILNRTLITFDIELLPNIFTCTFQDTETLEITTLELSKRKWQFQELVDWFARPDIFVGYNCTKYDSIVIQMMLNEKPTTNSQIYDIHEQVFGVEKPPYVKFTFRQIDLMTMLFSGKLRQSLKWLEILTMFDNVEEFEWEQGELDESKFDRLIEYNVNDVKATTHILNFAKDPIQLRLEIYNEYGLNVFSRDDVTIGEILLKHLYAQKYGYLPQIKEQNWDRMCRIKDLMLFDYRFIDEKTQIWFDSFVEKSINLKYPKINELPKIGNTTYSIRSGGIHSINEPEFIKETEDIGIMDIDVGSMYPKIIEEYKLFPEEFREHMADVYGGIRKERISVKKTNKPKSEMLKLCLNGYSGKLGQETSWTYNPECVLKLRLNGQIILLDLIDKLHSIGVNVFMANTDGITMTYKKSLLPQIKELIKACESKYNIDFEDVLYKTMAIENVSSYIAEYYTKDKDGNTVMQIKEKSAFKSSIIPKPIQPELILSLKPKIIAIAAKKYLIDGIYPKDYIPTHSDRKAFIWSQKIDRGYKVTLGLDEIQRTSRFIASKNGLYLTKIPTDEKQAKRSLEGKRESSEVRPISAPVSLCNKLSDIDNIDINYKWYIDETNKLVDKIKPIFKQLTLF